ncbi:MAG: glycosyltransferase family 2 protein [Deltaproteobacteria bacterium]|nr:glycosyltransferase family 2 protein [Deltaproteobacteria bacterium]
MSRTRPAPRVSVVIPLYNEARCLEKNAAATLAHLESGGRTHELLLVNDGSTDRTPEVVQRLADEHPAIRALGYAENRGKGCAVRTGMLAAHGDFVVFMDADLAVPLKHLDDCIHALESGADAAIASRHAQGAAIEVPESPLRRFMGEVFRQMCIRGMGIRASDVTCGMKAFTRRAAREVFSRAWVDRWSYDAEILLLAQRLNLKVAEIPVRWFHNPDSAVRVGRDAVESFRDLVLIRWRLASGKYGI